MCGTAGSSRTSTSLTPPSSESRLEKPRGWTRSSGLILEVGYEALEDGGQVLERLSGGQTGVFVGMSSFDYALIQTGFRDRSAVDVYTNTGGALSIAANRISYCLNFKGPSVVVDTACSSALTAVHFASHAIWKQRM